MIEPIVITAPVKEPVSLDEVKDQCSLDATGTNWNGLLYLFIEAARQYYEKRTARTIHDTTLEIVMDAFPCGSEIVLPRATPLISITSVKYKNSAGTDTTWATTEYLADTDNKPGRLVLGYNKSWPSFTPYPVNPIRIRYRAGIASSPIVEADALVKIPILMLVAGLFEQRESQPIEQGQVSAIALQYGVEAFIQQNVACYVF